MHNKKIIAKGLAFGLILSNVSVNTEVDAIEKYKTIKEIGNSNKVDSSKEREVKNPVKVNKDIKVGTVLEITVGDGEYVPDLTGNPDGYEAIRVTTTGSKKLIAQDYDNLRTSGMPKVDLSNASSDSIPEGVFSRSAHLTEFKFPQGVKSIDSSANLLVEHSSIALI